MQRHKRILVASLLIAAYCAAGAVTVARADPPPGMIYSGRATDRNGDPLAPGTYSMTISLYTTPSGGAAVWTETHPSVQVANGAFSIMLGNGTPAAPLALPFDQAYYLAVRVNPGPEMSPRQRLTSVPYALRAKIADQVPDQSITTEKMAPLSVTDDRIKSLSWSKITGIPGELTSASGTSDPGGKGKAGNVWSLAGNRGASPDEFLGTTDDQPLHIRVNNDLMMKLAVGGPISTYTGFEVAQHLRVGADADIQGHLRIVRSLSVGADADISGFLRLVRGLRVGEDADIAGHLRLARSLRVGEDAEFLGNATVGGNTSLLGNLAVTGVTTYHNTTDASSPSAAAFVVLGGAGIAKNLQVGGLATFNAGINVDRITATGELASGALHVTNSSPGYLATFVNTEGTTGSGIKIALGKTHPLWDGSDYVHGVDPIGTAFDGTIGVIRGWVFDHDTPSVDDIVNLFPTSILVGTACRLSNLVINSINSGLSLPYKIGPYGTSSIDLGVVTIPALDVVPRITVMPSIPTLNCSGFPSLGVPNLSFTDVSNSLTNSNEFIRFADKDERLLGAIRAESIEDWSRNYLDGNYFVNVMGSLAGIDVVGGIFGGIAEFSNLTKAYNQIGVEYMSGHGDYAEWLERVDVAEVITPGDIVGVRGGRITKDLTGAEHVFAVSHKPIVLGNMPPAEREHAGNKVAFMGQVPVKVQGPVSSGDYIVAVSEIPGYGIAVKPADMTPETFKLCVGRSWETRANLGPKIVNTVVGIVNHDFVSILQKAASRAEGLEARLRTLEEKVDLLSGTSGGNLRQAQAASVTPR